MSYSNKKIPNDPDLFPSPLRWMSWVEDRPWVNNGTGWTHGPATGEGKLRHHYDFPSARKAVSWIGSKSSYRPDDDRGIYSRDWAIYEWDETTGKWVERFSGLAGQKRDDNPMSKIRLKKGDQIHPIDKSQEDAALESIMKALKV